MSIRETHLKSLEEMREYSSEKTIRMRFHVGVDPRGAHSGGDRHGLQLQRRARPGNLSGFVLPAETPRPMGPAGNRIAHLRAQVRLSPVGKTDAPHHGRDLSIITGGHGARAQQGSGRRTAVADARRIFPATVGDRQVHRHPVHRQVDGETRRQTEKFRLRVSAQPDRAGNFFPADTSATGLRHRHDHFHRGVPHVVRRRDSKEDSCSIPCWRSFRFWSPR